MSKYYKEKMLKIHDSLFLSSLSARDVFIQNERLFEAAYLASKTLEDRDIQNKWDVIWAELNTETPLIIKGEIFSSSFCQTVLRKRNKTLEKYLHFMLEELYNVLNM